MRYRCKQCGTAAESGPELGGKQAKCLRCGAVFTVPVPLPKAQGSTETPAKPKSLLNRDIASGETLWLTLVLWLAAVLLIGILASPLAESDSGQSSLAGASIWGAMCLGVSGFGGLLASVLYRPAGIWCSTILMALASLSVSLSAQESSGSDMALSVAAWMLVCTVPNIALWISCGAVKGIGMTRGERRRARRHRNQAKRW